MPSSRFSVDVVFGATDKFSRPVRGMKSAVDGLNSGLKDRSFGQAWKTFSGGIEKTKNNLLGLGRGAIIGGTAVAFGLSHALGAGVDFERQMVRASSKFGDGVRRGTAEFEMLKQAAMDTGERTAYGATEAADGLYELATMGFDAQSAIAALPKLTAMATAGNLDLAQAATIASDSMGNFGLMFDELGNLKGPQDLARNMQRMSDVLSYTAVQTSTDMAGIYEAIQEAGPIAKVAGIDIEKFAAMTGALAQAGIKNSVAGTTLKNIFTRLLSPNSEGYKEFANLKLDTKKLRALADPMDQLEMIIDATNKLSREDKVKAIDEIFGKIPMAGAAHFLSGGVASARLLEAKLRANAGGSTVEQQNIMMDTTAAKLKNLENRWENLRIKMFDKLQTPIEQGIQSLGNTMDRYAPKVLTHLTEMANKLNNIPDKQWAEWGKDLEFAGKAAEGFFYVWAGTTAANALLTVGSVTKGLWGIGAAAVSATTGLAALASSGSIGAIAVFTSVITGLVGAVTALAAASAYIANEKVKEATGGMGTFDLLYTGMMNQQQNILDFFSGKGWGDRAVLPWTVGEEHRKALQTDAESTSFAAARVEGAMDRSLVEQANATSMAAFASELPRIESVLQSSFDATETKKIVDRGMSPLTFEAQNLSAVFADMAANAPRLMTANDNGGMSDYSTDGGMSEYPGMSVDPGVSTPSERNASMISETVNTNNATATVEVRAAKGTEARQVKQSGGTPIKMRRTGSD